jgi:ribose 5-phosphate isomerase B
MSIVTDIFLGSDHAGVATKAHLCSLLADGYHVHDLGPDSATQSVDYPDYASLLCKRLLAHNKPSMGILICGSGIGMSIAANRFLNIRAALCITEAMAELARQHNDANVLVLGARLIDLKTQERIVERFLKTDFMADRHLQRVQKLDVM